MSVRVYNRQYGLFSNQVMAPNGNIYITQSSRANLSWNENYDTNTVPQSAIFLHKLVHVYQNRTLGWSVWKIARPVKLEHDRGCGELKGLESFIHAGCHNSILLPCGSTNHPKRP